jgi:hypothetical protein
MALPPAFTSDGLLPPADYELTFDELRRSLLVAGPGADYPNWDVTWRRRLVDNLEILAKQLWQVGVRDRLGNELEFPSAFRQSRRDGKARGIVKLGGPP